MTDLEINEAFGKPMYEADPTNARYNSLQLQWLEEAGNELMYDNDDMANINRWHKAKEAKP
jgi:hypothetical protein